MLTVCGAAVAGVAIAEVAIAGTEAKAEVLNIPEFSKEDLDGYAKFGKDWEKDFPFTEEGRLVFDAGANIQEVLDEKYPNYRVIKIEELKLWVDFGNKRDSIKYNEPLIKQRCRVRIAPIGGGEEESLEISTFSSIRYTFVEKIHKLPLAKK